MLNPQLTRREFLKLASAGTLALALKDLRVDNVLAVAGPKKGRITWSGIPLYDAPTFQANKIHNFGADQILDITSIDENGEPVNPYNSVWYQINSEGYTYSGWIQPVELNYQKPKYDIPKGGQLGEITVPFSITR